MRKRTELDRIRENEEFMREHYGISSSKLLEGLEDHIRIIDYGEPNQSLSDFEMYRLMRIYSFTSPADSQSEDTAGRHMENTAPVESGTV